MHRKHAIGRNREKSPKVHKLLVLTTAALHARKTRTRRNRAKCVEKFISYFFHDHRPAHRFSIRVLLLLDFGWVSFPWKMQRKTRTRSNRAQHVQQFISHFSFVCDAPVLKTQKEHLSGRHTSGRHPERVQKFIGFFLDERRPRATPAPTLGHAHALAVTHPQALIDCLTHARMHSKRNSHAQNLLSRTHSGPTMLTHATTAEEACQSLGMHSTFFS